MIKIYARTWKRNSGKTYSILYDFLKNPMRSYIIVLSKSEKENLLYNYPIMKKWKDRIVTSIPDYFRGRDFKYLYIDNYFHINNVNDIIKIASPSLSKNYGSIYLTTSLEGFTEFDSFVYSLVRSIKRMGISRSDLKNFIDNKEIIKIIKEDLWDNLLTEPMCKFESHVDINSNCDLGSFLEYS